MTPKHEHFWEDFLKKCLSFKDLPVRSYILILGRFVHNFAGTGKSFIGALLAKVIHDFSDKVILVVCYTNHALDQFLEDLMDIGIPESSMVRIGGKASPRAERVSMHKQQGTDAKFTRSDWTELDALKTSAGAFSNALRKIFEGYKSFRLESSEFQQHLEFEYRDYYNAFLIPASVDGMEKVGKGGSKIEKTYLVDRWLNGQNPGVFMGEVSRDSARIWKMSPAARQEKVAQWTEEILRNNAEDIYTTGNDYNERITQIDRKFNGKYTSILQSKRIIGCTTTGAAKYRELINSAKPGVLLVEEAGEILESHILTAAGDSIEQIILIGDHR